MQKFNLRYIYQIFTVILFMTLFFAGYLNLFNNAYAAEKTRITFVHTNDLDRIEDLNGKGGFAKLAAIVNLERSKNKNTFFTHGGDTISPSILSSVDQGKHIIELLNEMKLDFMTLGNHEFDFGPEVTKKRISEAQFPILSTNVFENGTHRLEGTIESKLIEVDGFKIGFIGLTTPETVEVSSPGNVHFLPLVETAHAVVTKLKADGADFIVALSHTRIAENFSLIKSNIGIDFILGGHEEVVLNYFDDLSGILISKYEAEQISVVDIDLERIKSGDTTRLSWEPHFRNINSIDVNPDPSLYQKVKMITENIYKDFEQVIGKTATEIETFRNMVREGETAFTNFVTDALRDFYKGDVALINGGSIRGNKIYPPNSELTLKDIFQEVPFGKRVVVLNITGADLLAAVENGLESIDGISGGFPQVSGMSYTFDAALQKGERVVDIKIAGQPLVNSRTYRMVTEEYLYYGGEGYHMLKNAELIVAPADGLKTTEILIRKIKEQKTIAPKIEGRIIRIN